MEVLDELEADETGANNDNLLNRPALHGGRDLVHVLDASKSVGVGGGLEEVGEDGLEKWMRGDNEERRRRTRAPVERMSLSYSTKCSSLSNLPLSRIWRK